MKQTIYQRRSVRSYRAEPLSQDLLQEISYRLQTLTPLYPSVKVKASIVTREQVRTPFLWAPPHMIAIYSEEADGDLENVGFLFQQLDLYLQSIGLGSCWLGMGRMSKEEEQMPHEDGLRFVILLAFGTPKDSDKRTSAADFKRHTLAQISDSTDDRLEPARLAPSSINSQPWYFVHEGDRIHVYRTRPSRLKALIGLNRIDVGIALAQLFVENPDSFTFFTVDNPPAIKGATYTGTLRL